MFTVPPQDSGGISRHHARSLFSLLSLLLWFCLILFCISKPSGWKTCWLWNWAMSWVPGALSQSSSAWHFTRLSRHRCQFLCPSCCRCVTHVNERQHPSTPPPPLPPLPPKKEIFSSQILPLSALQIDFKCQQCYRGRRRILNSAITIR